MSWQERFATREDFHREVKKLVLEKGMSYSRAAEAIGFSTSKNQIVRAMQTIMGKSRSTVTFPDSVWPSTARPAEKVIEPEAPEAPVHLINAREGQCRAPLWPDHIRSPVRVDPSEHMFCGSRCKDKSAYCAKHHALFYPSDLQNRRAKAKPQPKESGDNSRYFQ